VNNVGLAAPSQRRFISDKLRGSWSGAKDTIDDVTGQSLRAGFRLRAV